MDTKCLCVGEEVVRPCQLSLPSDLCCFRRPELPGVMVHLEPSSAARLSFRSFLYKRFEVRMMIEVILCLVCILRYRGGIPNHEINHKTTINVSS